MDFEFTQDQNIFYESVRKFAENELAAGCRRVPSAGTSNQKVSDNNDAAFNTKYYGPDSTYSSGDFINRVGGVQQGFSGDHDIGKGTIRVGAIDCAVEPADEKQGATKYAIRRAA